jgi:quinol monooxygenase YgiN
MATILAHIDVHPGAEARFEALAAELYRVTHAEETAVRRYEYWRGETPGRYYSLLSFDDFRGFLAHQTSDHHEEASPALGEVIAAIRLEWVDPIADASPLTPTDGQEVPADASALVQRYARWFAPQIASWWAALRTR